MSDLLTDATQPFGLVMSLIYLRFIQQGSNTTGENADAPIGFMDFIPFFASLFGLGLSYVARVRNATPVGYAPQRDETSGGQGPNNNNNGNNI